MAPSQLKVMSHLGILGENPAPEERQGNFVLYLSTAFMGVH